jgi:hypothetical protein
MIYKNRDEILRNYLEWIEAQPRPVKGDEPELLVFRQLLNIYYDALGNPPEGIIGVGAITYAEQKLVEAQQ